MTSTDAPPLETLEALLVPELSAEQAELIYDQGREATVFALMTLAKKLAQPQMPPRVSDSPSTPSAMIPVYEKRTIRSRRKKAGRKAGHEGSRRKRPERIDHHITHTLQCCPHCQGKVTRTRKKRTRYVEDIADNIKPETTAHTLPRYWCQGCHQFVEPIVTEALPGSSLGNRTLVLSGWLHYGLGQTLSQIVDVFNYHLQMSITPGGLVQSWYRLQELLFGWYQQIQEQALASAVLHADETGWRVNGRGHWLWCFAASDLTYYLIDRRRSSKALRRFFRKAYAGTLVTDFWGAYNAVACSARQTCLVHLLRDLRYVEQYKSPGPHWPRFAKKLRRLLGDAIRLRKRNSVPADEYASRRDQLHARLQQLLETPWKDVQAKRLLKRLRRHQNDLFTFLDQADVPFDNNHGERAIRPAVIIRKNSYNNRSEKGADAQAVLMSIYRTLKQRGHDPMQTITQAIATYLKTGKLPPLPVKKTEFG